MDGPVEGTGETAKYSAAYYAEQAAQAANSPLANETTAGRTKLYQSLGTATDGAMSQKAITDSLTNLQTTIMGNFELAASSYAAAVTA